MNTETKEIRIDSLIPFKYHSGQTYTGERLQMMMDSIQHSGLMNPIIVRPVSSNKYEIISGHNRAKAIKELGHSVILADIRYDLSDDEAMQLFYESNLNQQSFSDWNYSQKIEAVRYTVKMIKEYSQQGKRNDLAGKASDKHGDETSVQTGQKSGMNPRSSTTRDKMARRLGISTATLSKYRRIIKLPDELVTEIAHLLDEKKISFEAAYMISDLEDEDIRLLINSINRNPEQKIDLDLLKTFGKTNKRKGDAAIICPITSRGILAVLTAQKKSSSSDILTPIRRSDVINEIQANKPQ